jgi:hypothetical protein
MFVLTPTERENALELKLRYQRFLFYLKEQHGTPVGKLLLKIGRDTHSEATLVAGHAFQGLPILRHEKIYENYIWQLQGALVRAHGMNKFRRLFEDYELFRKSRPDFTLHAILIQALPPVEVQLPRSKSSRTVSSRSPNPNDCRFLRALRIAAY